MCSVKNIYVYLGTAFSALFILIFVMELWRADLSIPFTYERKGARGEMIDPVGNSDAFLYQSFFKGIKENGWYLSNPSLGAPTGNDNHDFPMGDNWHFAIVKVIGWFVPNFGWAANIYFILGFPLTAAIAAFVFRQFNFSALVSSTFGLLYAFLPYHFFHGESHPFLASYYLVPLMILVVIWLIDGDALLVSTEHSGKLRLDVTSKGWFGLALCFLMGITGVYYMAFGIYCLTMGCLVLQRNKKGLVNCAAFIGTIVFSALLNITPTFLYIMKHGVNHRASVHLNSDGEVWGLKLIQMVIPVMRHRIDAFAKAADFYYTHSPLVHENIASSVGLLGATGLVMLLAWQLGVRWKTVNDKLVTNLSFLSMCLILLGTIGGFSSFLCYGISPLVRAYTRVSIFIAFLCLALVALLLEKLRGRFQKTVEDQCIWALLILFLGFFALLDQTSDLFIPPYDQNAASFKSDRDFIHRMEETLPSHAMVFELPYSTYYEGLNGGNNLLRGYLHSRQLRWSYGVMAGRPEEEWIPKMLTDGDFQRISKILKEKNFAGIYVDRPLLKAYRNADKIEESLRQDVDPLPLISENKRLAFYRFK